jgi:phosphomannomutase
MAEAAIRGASDAGVEVFDLGLVGTEMVYFAVGELELDGGIAVTASHNPKEYTGMKIVRRGALPVGGESGLLDIRDRARSGFDRDGGQTPGPVQKYDVWPAFVERVLSLADVSAIRPLRVVIDAANGMAGVMLPPVLAHLPIETVRFRTMSRTRSSPRTASSSSRRRSRRKRTSAWRSTATQTAASSSTTPASSCRATSRRPSSPSRSSSATRARR